MASRRCISPLFIVLACSLQVHALFPQAAASFLEVSVRHDPHHGHEDGAVTTDPQHGHEHAEHDSEPQAAEKPHHEAAVHEHVEHGAKPQHSGVNGDCPGNQSANSVAVGLMFSVIFMPLIVYMTMTKAAGGAVSDLTFRMIDLSTSIFLAVLWFSAANDIMESEHVHKIFPHSEEVFAISQVIVLYVVTMIVAYHFRHNKYYLLTFCGCAAHYIAFSGIKAAGESQHKVGTLVDSDDSLYASFGFCFILFAVFAFMSFVCFMSWRRYVKDEEMHLAIEELEMDIIGLVMSFAIMQALRHALTGHYPSQAHMLLQQAISALETSAVVECNGSSNHPHVQHTAQQRGIMLAFSVGLTLIACVSLQYLEALKEKSTYWTHKAVQAVQVVLVMCAAWGYLLWGEWQFYETYFHGDKMFGKMVFAVLATALCLIIITSLAFATNERSSKAKGYAGLVILAISLVTAWSWEHCFHTAINVIAEQYQVGYGGLVPKIVIAFAVPLIILPGYIVFLKPIAVEIDERLNAEEKEVLNAHLSAVMYTAPPAEEAGAPAATSTA